MVARYLPTAATPAIRDSSFGASRPTLAALPSSHAVAVAWKNGTFQSDLAAVLDDNNVEFTMLGVFQVQGLCHINGEDAAAVVIAVRQASLSRAEARNAVGEVCLLLER